MANLKDDIKEAKKLQEELMQLNQNTFIRNNISEITGVNWCKEKHKKMFHLLLNLSGKLEMIKYRTDNLF